MRLERRFAKHERLRRRFARLRIERLTGASLGEYLQYPAAYEEHVRAMRNGRGIHRDDFRPHWAVVR